MKAVKAIFFSFGGCLILLLLMTMSCRFTRVHTLARLGHVDSMCELANAHSSFSGKGLTRGSDWGQATYWYEKAAEKGYAGADFCLFQMWQVQGKPEDIRRWLERGAKNGSPECIMQLANAYEYGLYGFPRDKELSNYWTKKMPKWRP